MKRSVIFGLLLINFLFISADTCVDYGTYEKMTVTGTGWYTGCCVILSCGSCCTQACNPNSIAGCSTSCSVCGDSLKEGPEECDDGNTKSGDSCSSTCKTETYSSNYCGDNILFVGSEECDDGNNIDYDSCSSTCNIETYSSSYCGDNILFVGSEECDDGNLISFDGCSNICEIETYKNSYCGDGIWFKGYEECDDKNNNNGDGCSNVCVLQPEAYFLDSNGLKINKANIGETVKLVLNNTGILNGSFRFESNRLEILVQDVTPWCSNYETEVSCSDCDYIGCNAAENSVNEKVFEAFPEV